ncbi:MAG: hypothetical protein J1E62_03215 [Lachnospiraceae bacterium]|nr:hypothetical protein [Lachnospiraceae bacterium]
MSRQTYDIIITVFFCWVCFLVYKEIKFLKKILTYSHRLRQIMSNSATAIRLINTEYVDSKKNLLILTICDIVVTVCLGFQAYIGIINPAFRRSTPVFFILTIVMLLAGIRAALVYRYAEDAFLEKDVLVCIDGIYTKAEQTFSFAGQWSEGENKLQYVTVQSEKMKNPKQFKIIEKDDEVVEIIKKYYQ